MQHIKPLRPAHKEKKRYIVYEADYEPAACSMFTFQQELVRHVQQMLGVFDSARAGILPVKVDNQTHKGILRVNHHMVDKVRSCFLLTTHLGRVKARVHTRTVSGILKKAKTREGFPKENNRKK